MNIKTDKFGGPQLALANMVIKSGYRCNKDWPDYNSVSV